MKRKAATIRDILIEKDDVLLYGTYAVRLRTYKKKDYLRVGKLGRSLIIAVQLTLLPAGLLYIVGAVAAFIALLSNIAELGPLALVIAIFLLPWFVYFGWIFVQLSVRVRWTIANFNTPRSN